MLRSQIRRSSPPPRWSRRTTLSMPRTYSRPANGTTTEGSRCRIGAGADSGHGYRVLTDVSGHRARAPPLRSGRLGLARHAAAEVDNSRAEGAGLDEFEVHPALALGEERNATADQHRVDPGPVLVDQTQRGRLGGESRAADRDVALLRLGSQPLDLLRHAAGGQAGIALHRRQRGGEHHLWERLPDRGPLEHRVVERWILVGGLPVQHRLVQPSSQQVDADLSYLVGDEAKDLLVGRRPAEVAVRPDDVAVKRDAHRIGHAAHQKSSSVTGSTVRPPDAAGLIAARGTGQTWPVMALDPGAKKGANGDSSRATSSHAQPRSMQLIAI